jgi:hypothetical protein
MNWETAWELFAAVLYDSTILSILHTNYMSWNQVFSPLVACSWPSILSICNELIMRGTRNSLLGVPAFIFGRWINDRKIEVGTVGIDTLGEEGACCKIA